ncbi:hypothetical protein Q4488_13930 [Amphritea sp. 1_MG-2023]|uniref:hypothetical protein n=1 Tax=Amphritea sp. 1_MG-2023 TaxID=3062670 RepID=UPI0026E15399|nr:hypothetical protein [Amphritea sp. 1_MG-2023]MDO6564485.1 hypothetical protein [Amphritea sp. 1_MG-2023]
MSHSKVMASLEKSPLPGLLTQLGTAIASAQRALDDNSIQMAMQLGDAEEHGVDVGDGEKVSLISLGFAPVFYHFNEATIDIRVSLSTSTTTETKFGTSATVGGAVYFVMFAATVSAEFSNKYSFSSEASSSITARISSIPPPNAFQNWIASRQQASLPTDTE